MKTLSESYSLSVLQSFELAIRREKSKRIARSLNLVSRYSQDMNLLMEELIKGIPRSRPKAIGSLADWEELKIILWSPWADSEELAHEAVVQSWVQDQGPTSNSPLDPSLEGRHRLLRWGPPGLDGVYSEKSLRILEPVINRVWGPLSFLRKSVTPISGRTRVSLYERRQLVMIITLLRAGGHVFGHRRNSSSRKMWKSLRSLGR